MATLMYNLLRTTLTAPLGLSDTTISLSTPFEEGGVNIPDIVLGVDEMVINIGGTELATVTEYTSGDPSATVVRATHDSLPQLHAAGEAVKNVPTKESFTGGGGSGTSIESIAGSAAANATTEVDDPGGTWSHAGMEATTASYGSQLAVDADETGALTAITAYANGFKALDLSSDLEASGHPGSMMRAEEGVIFAEMRLAPGVGNALASLRASDGTDEVVVAAAAGGGNGVQVVINGTTLAFAVAQSGATWLVGFAGATLAPRPSLDSSTATAAQIWAALAAMGLVIDTV